MHKQTTVLAVGDGGGSQGGREPWGWERGEEMHSSTPQCPAGTACQHRPRAGLKVVVWKEMKMNTLCLVEHRFVHTEGSNVFLGANKAQGEANNTVVIGCLWRASQTKLHWFVLL